MGRRPVLLGAGLLGLSRCAPFRATQSLAPVRADPDRSFDITVSRPPSAPPALATGGVTPDSRIVLTSAAPAGLPALSERVAGASFSILPLPDGIMMQSLAGGHMKGYGEDREIPDPQTR